MKGSLFLRTSERRRRGRVERLAKSLSTPEQVDAFASRALEILQVMKRERRTFLKEAARRGISLEQLTAAAIAGALAEFMEGGEETSVSSGA